MKRYLVFLFLFLFKTLLFAQDSVIISADSDTAFWYGYKNAYAKQFQLGLLEKDTADYSFRFWSSGMVVKVATKGNQSAGEVVRFVEAYPGTTYKTFKKQYVISSINARRLINLIDSLQLESLPSDKNIAGWQQGLDGITYFIEYKQGKHYSFKHYWTPSSQDSLKEAILLLGFINTIETELDLKNNYKQFETDIPFDGWKYPGSSSAALRVKPKNRKKNGS